eukprot:8254929-Lingulodinium_polyedra.AAC.1
MGPNRDIATGRGKRGSCGLEGGPENQNRCEGATSALTIQWAIRAIGLMRRRTPPTAAATAPA